MTERGSSSAWFPPEAAHDIVERSRTAQGLPERIVDAATLRAVAIVIAHQSNKPRERTSAASDRARSDMEDDNVRRPAAL